MIGASAVAPTDKLKVINVHAQLAAFSAALLVFPGVVLQPTFDEDRLALGHVLVNDLGLPTKSADIDEGHFLAVLAVGGFEFPVTRQPELDNRRLRRQVFQRRVTREISHQEDSVE